MPKYRMPVKPEYKPIKIYARKKVFRFTPITIDHKARPGYNDVILLKISERVASKENFTSYVKRLIYEDALRNPPVIPESVTAPKKPTKKSSNQQEKQGE